MPLNFPANPTLNESYSYGNTTWTFNGSGWIVSAGVTPATTAGGDLTGTYPNPTIASGKVTPSQMATPFTGFATPVGSTAPATGSVTADMLTITVGEQLGLTQQATPRRVVLATPVEIASQNNGNSVDVTGVSGTIMIPNTTGYSVVTIKADLRMFSGNAPDVAVGMVIGNYTSSWVTTASASYTTLSNTWTVPNAQIGNGSKTVKLIFRGGYSSFECCGSWTYYYSTARIQNSNLTAYSYA